MGLPWGRVPALCLAPGPPPRGIVSTSIPRFSRHLDSLVGFLECKAKLLGIRKSPLRGSARIRRVDKQKRGL